MELFFLSLASHSFDSFQLILLEFTSILHPFSLCLVSQATGAQFHYNPKTPWCYTHRYTRLCTWVSFGVNCRATVLLLVWDKTLITVASSVHSWVFLERTVAPHHVCLIRLIGSQHWANLTERCAWLSVLISNCICLVLNEPLLRTFVSHFSR